MQCKMQQSFTCIFMGLRVSVPDDVDINKLLKRGKRFTNMHQVQCPILYMYSQTPIIWTFCTCIGTQVNSLGN